jgi:hypothetical protein
MTTALHVINRAFGKIGVRAAETPLTASEVQDGLDTLNDMLSEWDNTGILKGVFPVKEPEDALTMPRYADGAVKNNLAIRLASEYDRDITAGMAQNAKDSMGALISASINLNITEYPSILPTGSGNTGDKFGIGDNSEFFKENPVKHF